MRVWFNHWFSTAYHLIQLIKNANPDKFTFVGSNKNDYAIYKRICDEWYIEPQNINESDYVDYCIKFCKQHQIDIFVPRRHLTSISNHLESFNDIGVKVLTGQNPHLMQIFDDKVRTYEYISNIGLSNIIPKYQIVKSFEEFEQAYNSLKTPDNRICYKLVKDEGAVTFRVIDNSIETSSALYNMPNMKITYTAAIKILSNYKFVIPIIVMPYLDGQEISVDCLSTPKGNIIIPRYKTNHRYSVIHFESHIMDISNEILQTLNMGVPINIQFKFHNNKPFLLEINPRMSGGLQLSCLGSNINIPDIAINQLIGTNRDWRYPDYDSCRVANIESPICLEVI